MVIVDGKPWPLTLAIAVWLGVSRLGKIGEVIKQLLQFIEQLRYGMRRSTLPDGFPFWGFTDPRIGDLNLSDRRVSGHTPRQDDTGDWRCICGRPLSGGSRGNGRAAAREAMRIHRLDLNHPEHATEEFHAAEDEIGTPDAA